MPALPALGEESPNSTRLSRWGDGRGQREPWRPPHQWVEQQQGELSSRLASDFPLEKRDRSRSGEVVGNGFPPGARGEKESWKSRLWQKSAWAPTQLRLRCLLLSVTVRGSGEEGEGLPHPLVCVSLRSYGVKEGSPFANSGLKVSPTLQSFKTRKMHYKFTIPRRKMFLCVHLCGIIPEPGIAGSMWALSAYFPFLTGRRSSHNSPSEWSLHPSHLYACLFPFLYQYFSNSAQGDRAASCHLIFTRAFLEYIPVSLAADSIVSIHHRVLFYLFIFLAGGGFYVLCGNVCAVCACVYTCVHACTS